MNKNQARISYRNVCSKIAFFEQMVQGTIHESNDDLMSHDMIDHILFLKAKRITLLKLLNSHK